MEPKLRWGGYCARRDRPAGGISQSIMRLDVPYATLYESNTLMLLYPFVKPSWSLASDTWYIWAHLCTHDIKSHRSCHLVRFEVWILKRLAHNNLAQLGGELIGPQGSQ